MSGEPHRCVDDIRQARWTNPDTGRIVAHPYEASPHSGAGNCWCGRDEAHRLHDQPAKACVKCGLAFQVDAEHDLWGVTMATPRDCEHELAPTTDDEGDPDATTD